MRLGRQWILCVWQKLDAGGGDSRVHLLTSPGIFIWNGSVQDVEYPVSKRFFVIRCWRIDKVSGGDSYAL